MDQLKRRWPLFQKRQVSIPTWRGWLLFFIVAALLCRVTLHQIYGFLAPNDPVDARTLVLEGWAPDYAMEAALEEFKAKAYDRLYVTGGPIEHGAPLSECKDYATLGAAVLQKLGLQTNVVQPVPAPFVQQDRTYTSAVTLREWLNSHGQKTAAINILTVGPHARRTRLLFRKAFGAEPKLGVVALPEIDFDPKRWWHSSQGFRTVTGELIAYVYAKLLFHPRVDSGINIRPSSTENSRQ